MHFGPGPGKSADGSIGREKPDSSTK
jgi:hypothetical protein